MHLPQASLPPFVPTEPSLWSGTADSTTPAASSHAAFTASPPLPPQSVATGDVLDPAILPSPTLALEESLPPLPDAKQETSPSHASGGHVLLEPTQPVAGPSTLPATRLQPQRAAKRRRHEDEQENEAVVWLPGPTDNATKGKAKATATESLLIDAVESSEGHAADNTKVVPGSQAVTAAVATLRRSKRRRVEAVSQLHTTSVSAPSDPVASTSNVSGMTRSPSATPTPTPLPTPPQPTGPACMLLNKDGTRCHHALTMDNARDKDHANSHSRANVGDPGFRCTFPGCNKQYATKHSRNKHIMGHHWGLEFPCDVPGCTKVYGRADEVSRHKRLAHGA
ncbi:hypothetical protein GY45DRAFT_789932 [Cubamyces sp. BRFM 1775]|nr:hypothetical protein GY45DRAFT_789932 [Cubamyces sp. BRFM 1775]